MIAYPPRELNERADVGTEGCGAKSDFVQYSFRPVSTSGRDAGASERERQRGRERLKERGERGREREIEIGEREREL